jgi:hypothetical protein
MLSRRGYRRKQLSREFLHAAAGSRSLIAAKLLFAERNPKVSHLWECAKVS